MDKKFLDKVLDQIVSETSLDYDWEIMETPFFSDHCRDVYGLNGEEIEYIWEEYREIIKDKIENG